MSLHIIKLCVGCDTVDELLAWRREAHPAGGPWILRTRQTPKLAHRVVEGGSLYRVFKGFVLSRQRILEVRTVGEGLERRCEMVLDETLVLTDPAPRRAFQGWRYLEPGEAPADLGQDVGLGVLPPEFARRLKEAGAW